jgi:hypothetical protein
LSNPPYLGLKIYEASYCRLHSSKRAIAIREALNKETREMAGLILMEQSAANSPDGLGLLNFLLAGSAANILNALTRFTQSIETFDKIAGKPAD